MADRVELAFRRAARALIPERAKVLVAVSGGADSMALLRLLHGAARTPRWGLAVAHLDHGLRRGSRADRRFVEDAAVALGLPFLSDRREVATLRRRDESPEEAARRVRRAFLREVAEETGASRIALGHTLDDQAETVLLRLARGAGPTALSGMSPDGPGPFVRPLLEIAREDLRGWLARRKIPFREDPSNRRLEIDRNRVRRKVLPALREINPAAARHLAEAAARSRDDALWLDAEAERRLGKGIACDARALASLPTALAGRAARLLLLRAGCDPRRISVRHVEALLSLAAGPGRAGLDLPSGVVAKRRGREIAIGPRGD